MTLHTLESLKTWLADDSQLYRKRTVKPQNGLNFTGQRMLFPLKKAKLIIIQQSALHDCTVDSVEMWGCPDSPLLLPYGLTAGGRYPYTYACVPLPVVVDYLNEQENL